MGFVLQNLTDENILCYNGVMDKRNRTVLRQVRLTEKEAKRLDERVVEKGYFLGDPKAQKPNRSLYLRNLIATEDNSALSNIDLVQLRKEFANLSRVGGNLNRLVHHLNEQRLLHKMQEKGHPPILGMDVIDITEMHVKSISEEVDKLADQFLEILEKLRIN